MRVISGKARGCKLYTLEGENTRPTLDRVKEALFSKIQMKLEDANVLDLFSGSGALGIESLSRGAKFAVFCDISHEASMIVKRNLEKTRFQDVSKLYETKFENTLEKLKNEKIKFDVVFLDPPYKTDYIKRALELIMEYDLLNRDAIAILETDEQDRIIKEIENIDLDIFDIKRYGRVSLIFVERKG